MKIKDRAKPKLPPVEPGVYVAICIGVIDLGEQYSEKFKKYSNDVKIVWELVGVTVEVDGEQKPRQLSRDFHIAMSKKSTLRAVLSSWNGRQYTDDEFRELDLFDQLGLPCQLNVVLNDTGEYANVDSVIPLPRGMPVPATSSALLRWDMEQWSDEAFGELPEWAQEKIKKSTQYQQMHAPSDPVDFPSGGAAAPSAAPAPTSPTTEECPI